MKKILFIVGARPQFIKLAPLSRIIDPPYQQIIIHTGQHFDHEMSEFFFNELEIPKPAINLDVNRGSHGEQTGKMLIALEKEILSIKPDLVVVFGDTNSTLAGTLVASKLRIPSIHIEAGLRSFNREMPEEINRIVSDHTADYLFAPTGSAMKNLEREGLAASAVLTGDIMVDTLSLNLDKAAKKSTIQESLGLKKNEYIVLTLHRPYNVDNPEKLKRIIQMLGQLPDKIVFPVHPRTSHIIKQNNIQIPANFIISKPLGYFDFLKLQAHSKKVITDSGGIQKEAYILRKPCLTLRSETEWIETVEDGWNKLINIEATDAVAIIRAFEPTAQQSGVFGENVGQQMKGEIESILKQVKN